MPTEAVQSLILARTHAPHSPLAATPNWPAAFHHAGQRLADLAHRGELTRGLRAVLTHHLLFAWNRAGIPGRQQALLAATAACVAFDHQPLHTRELIRHLTDPLPR
jgi:protein-L-isoaspartate(D-aspartate) O-methyltransferase